MPDEGRPRSRHQARDRGPRIDTVMAEVVVERSTRTLYAAADDVLEASRSRRPARELARVAEMLSQHGAVQDLVARSEPGLVPIDHRLAALARGMVDAHPRLLEVSTAIDRLAVPSRSARWIVALAGEVIGSFAADPGESGGTAVALGLALDGDSVAVVAAGPSGDGPSLHLDGARRLVVAMGGRMRETIDGGVRGIRIRIPCRITDRKASW